MKSSNKRAFTLLEIMIAMVILSIVGSVVGWQMKKMISSHHFQSDANQFCIALQEAQLLAVTHQTDFDVRIFPRSYQITTQEPLSVVRNKKVKFRQVSSLTLQDKKTQEIHLHIYSSGRIEPHNFIGFHQNKESSLWIDLQTPLQIKYALKRPLELKERFPALPKERDT